MTDQAPVAANDSYSVVHDQTLTDSAPGVLRNDTDADGDAITAVQLSGVSHGTLTLNSDGSFTYTPALHYVGTDSFTYYASDGVSNSNTATVTISVTEQPPVAQNDAYSVAQNQTLTIAAPGVQANDSDPDGASLTSILVANVQHGTLSLSANGAFTYTPASQFVGTDSFTYKDNDGIADSKVATVTLNVTSGGTVTLKELHYTGFPGATGIPLTEPETGAVLTDPEWQELNGDGDTKDSGERNEPAAFVREQKNRLVIIRGRDVRYAMFRF